MKNTFKLKNSDTEESFHKENLAYFLMSMGYIELLIFIETCNCSATVICRIYME